MRAHILIAIHLLVFLIISTSTRVQAASVRSHHASDGSPVFLWPLPASFTSGSSVLLVDENLGFTATGEDSAILQNAFARYQNLIFDPAACSGLTARDLYASALTEDKIKEHDQKQQQQQQQRLKIHLQLLQQKPQQQQPQPMPSNNNIFLEHVPHRHNSKISPLSSPTPSPPPPPRATFETSQNQMQRQNQKQNQNQKQKQSATVISEVLVNVISSDLTLNLETDESYTLTTSDTTIDISAQTVFGALRALETLSQLIRCRRNSNDDDGNNNNNNNNKNHQVQFIIEHAPWTIKDAPRFPHRGFLLDTSRHYFPVSSILRLLDGMSYVKLNVFHWHIVDSQSFPVQSDTYPELSAKGAYHSNSMVYTKLDVQRVVQYALERGIRVIPEFDSPGHTTSWGAAFPDIVACANREPWSSYCNEPPCGQLDPTVNRTYQVIEGLFSEMASWFPDDTFHAGGDEVNMNCWQSEPPIQQYMKQNKINNPVKLLQMYYDRTYPLLANTLRKNVAYWEEVIVEFNLTVSKDALIQVWKSASNAQIVVDRGNRVIQSSYQYWYLDCGRGSWIHPGNSWCDPFKSWWVMYSYEPTAELSPEGAKLVVGGEGCMWSESTDANNVESVVWPRLSAVAERLWSPREVNSQVDALPRIMVNRDILVQRGLHATPLQPTWCLMNPGKCLL